MVTLTPAEHAQQKAWVLAREMMEPTQTERNGSYARRTRTQPPVVPALIHAPVHTYVIPVVTERTL